MLFSIVLVAGRDGRADDAVDADALVHMGLQAEHGEGRLRDPVVAAGLYCDAAREGNAEAAYLLGWMYFNGRGVERNDAMAAGLFLRAKERGQAFAEVSLRHLRDVTPVVPDCLLRKVVAVDVLEQQPELDHALQSVKPDRLALIKLVLEMAPRFGVDPRLALSVMMVESNFSITAKSQKGAQGLMQLIPETAERFNVKSPLDPKENIRGGLTYLRWLLAYFQGRTELVLAGYNAGEKAVDRYRGIPPFPETREYVKKVLTLYRKRLHPFDRSITTASTAPLR